MKRPRGGAAAPPESTAPVLPAHVGISVSAIPLPTGWERASIADLVRGDLAAAPAVLEARNAYVEFCRDAALAHDAARVAAARALAAAAAASASPAEWGAALDISAEASGGAPPDRKADGYTGRPLRGATSAALYLAAEHAAGAPPRLRDRWRHVIGPGADGADGGAAAAAAALLNPSRAAALREELKRPAWPDRAFPHTLFSSEQRPLAIAASFDAAATDARLADGLARRALTALLREEAALAAAAAGAAGGLRGGEP